MRLFLVIFAVEALAASWIEIGNGIYELNSYRVEALAASWLKYVRPLKSLFQQCKALAASWN